MKTFTQWIMEGRSFEYSGSKYSSGFGKYTKDGQPISKEEYQKASDAYKNGGKKSSTPKKKEDKKTITKKSKEETPKKKNTKPSTPFEKMHTHCKTIELLRNTAYKPVKSLKECEEQISKFTGKKVYLAGVTTKEVYNGIGESIHKVFSKYPYLGDSKSILYFATQSGMNKSVEADVEEYLNSDDFKKSLQKDLDWVKTKYNFAKIGENAGKQIYSTGMTIAECRKFREKFKIEWDTPIDERISKLLTDKYIEVRTKKKKKEYRESLIPSEFKAKNAYAFYINSPNEWSSWKKWAGIYFSPTNMKKSAQFYDLQVQHGFNPKGTTHSAIVTHEMGHALDNMLKLHEDEEIRNLYRTTQDIDKEVSKYARTSVKEFIAECFAEYMHSPEPRPLCVKVGKIIDKKYELYAMAMEVIGDAVEKGEIDSNQVNAYRDMVIANAKNKLGEKK